MDVMAINAYVTMDGMVWLVNYQWVLHKTLEIQHSIRICSLMEHRVVAMDSSLIQHFHTIRPVDIPHLLLHAYANLISSATLVNIVY
jgi:hypothetical protein